jgi:hypothetical protein
MAELIDLRIFEWVASCISNDDSDLVVLTSAFGAFFVKRSTFADSVAVGAKKRRTKIHDEKSN